MVEGYEKGDYSRDEHALGGGGEVHKMRFGGGGDCFGAGLAESELE